MKSAGALLVLGLLSSIFPAALFAEESPAAEAAMPADAGLGLAASIDVVGKYIWRGYDLGHGDPWSLTYLTWTPDFAPGLSLSTGLLVGLKNDPAEGDDHTQIDEWDLSASWEIEVAEGFSVAVGVLYYDYRGDWTQNVAYLDDDDAETSLVLKLADIAGFEGSLGWYHGLDDKIEGDYLEIAATREFPVAAGVAFAPKLAAGWSTQYDVDGKWTHLTIGLPLAWSGEWWSVAPSISYSRIFDPDFMNRDDDHDLVWGGLNLSASF